MATHEDYLGKPETYEPITEPQPTLRDRFAMAALTGMCSYDNSEPLHWNYDNLATCAYQAADAMLKAREQKGE